jgi:hypothetical protein
LELIAVTARRLRIQVSGRKVWIDQTFFRKDKVMLRSLRQLYGKKLGASDGDIGHVKDFYFNDQQWGIRYVVAGTGSWLSGRLVLIPPSSQSYSASEMPVEAKSFTTSSGATISLPKVTSGLPRISQMPTQRRKSPGKTHPILLDLKLV